MLNDAQLQTVWDSWIGAEIRASYFAALSASYRSRQRLLTIGTLVLSSGAFLSVVSALPDQYKWVRAVLTLCAALLSAISLVSRNESASLDSADLHFRWNTLAMDYGALWADPHTSDAAQTLNQLQKREAEISKSSAAQPANTRMLKAAQANVHLHHGEVANTVAVA